MPLVEPADFPHTGRGQRAVRAIAKGEVVASVGLVDCWTESGARVAPEVAPLLPAIDLLRPRVLRTPAQALHLLCERGKGAESPRHAHIRTLPPIFDMPLFWSEAELEALRGTAGGWHAFALRARVEARADWSDLEAAVGAGTLEALGADRASYTWACAVLQSRVMDVAGAEPLMAPGLDLFNHTVDPEARGSFGYDEATGRVWVRAYRDFAEGEQVFISYGQHANPSLLFSYGFAVPTNPADALEVSHEEPFGSACGDDASRLRSALLLRAATQHAAAGAGEAGEDSGAAGQAPLALDIPAMDDLASTCEVSAMRIGLRHRLTAALPLPVPLLVIGRLQQLGDRELRLLDASPALLDAAAGGAPVSPPNEVALVANLRRQVDAWAQTLATWRATAPEDEQARRRASAARLLVDGEKAVLNAVEVALHNLARRASSVPHLLPAAEVAEVAVPAVGGAHSGGDGWGGSGPTPAPQVIMAGASGDNLNSAASVEPVPVGEAVTWDADAPAPLGAVGNRPRGALVCVRGVAAGEVLYTVPLSECVSADIAAEDARLVRALGGRVDVICERALVPLYLVLQSAEEGEEGALHEWLPGSLHLHAPAVAWPEADLAHLEGSRWVAEVRAAQADWSADWSDVRDRLGRTREGRSLLEQGRVTEERFRWGCLAARAASVEVLGPHGGRVALLVPRLAVGCAHLDRPGPTSAVTVHEDATGVPLACVRAACALAAGEVAQVCLGFESTGELLAWRGFAVAENSLERVDVSLSLGCTAETLQAAMLAAPEAPTDPNVPSAFEFIKVPTEADVEASAETADASMLITRHGLTRADPLPPALLALVRLERLTTAELEVIQADLRRTGRPLWAVLQAGDELSPANELHTLNALEAMFCAMLRAYTTCPPRDATAATRPPLERPEGLAAAVTPEADMAVHEKGVTVATGGLGRTVAAVDAEGRACAALEVVRGEQAVLHAALVRVHALRDARARAILERLYRLPGKRPDEVSPWAHFLRTTRPRLDALQHQVGRTCSRLHAAATASLDPDGVAAAVPEAAAACHALHARTCTAAFSWLLGLGPEAADGPIATPEGGGAYGALFASKMVLWGSFLMAQWLEATTLGLSDMNTMLMESVSVRTANSWSVPCGAAVRLLAALGPLQLAGDANRVWGSALRETGADAVNLGPGDAPADGRVLVMVWTDAEGADGDGLRLVEGYGGDRLATIGEWAGPWTHGEYAPGLSPHGQAFSAETQAYVEHLFWLESSEVLPNWPMARDGLLVWRRRTESAPSA